MYTVLYAVVALYFLVAIGLGLLIGRWLGSELVALLSLGAGAIFASITLGLQADGAPAVFPVVSAGLATFLVTSGLQYYLGDEHDLK
jgi:hypothetical protein